MNQLDVANDYIRKNSSKVKCKPTYHFSPPIGWMNDPNGFCFHKGEYHLFYQLNPYDVVWSNIHWGHAVSSDLLNWKHKPVAMACDTPQDINGCFSGSAIEKDDELYLMYTGHIDHSLDPVKTEDKIIQQQCLAKYHEDGTVVKSSNNPVISMNMLNNNYQVRDFRDPKIYCKDGEYYCVLAARNTDDRGSILLYKSKDLEEWHFVSDIYRRPVEDNLMFECPDLFTVDGKDVLVISLMPCTPEYEGIIHNQVQYIIGKMNYENGLFEEESRGIIDNGSNYYAPQTTLDKNGNRIIIGWICEWSNKNSKFVKEYGYNGIMTMPRKINITSGELKQIPATNMEEYEQEVYAIEDTQIDGKYTFTEQLISQHIHMQFSSFKTTFTIQVLGNESKGMSFTFNPVDNYINAYSNYTLKVDKDVPCAFNNKVQIDIYIDNNCVELYVNGKAFTFLCYDFDKGKDITISTENSLKIDLLKQMKISNVVIA